MAPVEKAAPNEESSMEDTAVLERSPTQSGALQQEEHSVKEEDSDDCKLHEELQVKVEEDDNIQNGEIPLTFSAMKEDEGFILPKEESSSDLSVGELQKFGADDICKLEKEDCGKSSNALEDSLNRALFCTICMKQFSRVFYYNQHVKTHQNTIKNPVGEKPHRCGECGKTFALLQHLAGHSRIHIAGKYYECPVCKRKFTELSNLTMHLLKTHPDEKPYKCPECEKQFTQSSALKKHMRGHSDTPQEELDRIDTLFLVDDGTEKDIEEPSSKKIKLEKDENGSSPSKGRIQQGNTRQERSPSAMEKGILSQERSPSSKEKADMLRRKSLSPKEKSLLSKEKSLSPKKEILSVPENYSSLDLSSTFKAKQVSSNNKPLPIVDRSSSAEGTVPSISEMSISAKQMSPRKANVLMEVETSEVKKVSPHLKETLSSKIETSQSPIEVTKPVSKSLSSSNKKSSTVEESDSPRECTTSVSKETVSPQIAVSCSAPSSEFSPATKMSDPGDREQSDGRDSSSLKNGVPLDQVQNPLIKVTKYAKKGDDCDVQSHFMSKSLTSSRKFVGVINASIALESSQQIEAPHIPSKFAGDKLFMNRSSSVFVPVDKHKAEKREPFLSLENPDQKNSDRRESGKPDKNKSEKIEPALHAAKEDKPSKKQSSVPEGKREDYNVRFRCHRCEIFFETEEELHAHLMHDAGVKLAECRFCGKDFTKMSSLKKHLYYHVIGSISQYCTRCNKSFITFRDLKEHAALNNCDSSGHARFKCFRCKKYTTSLKKLKIHLLSQCNEDPVKYYFRKQEKITTINDGEKTSLNEEEKSTEDINSAMPSDQNKWVNQKFEKKNENTCLSKLEGLNFEPHDIEALQILNDIEPIDQCKEKDTWSLQCQNCNRKFPNSVEAQNHSKLDCVPKPESESEPRPVRDKESLKIKVVFEDDEESQCFLHCSECDQSVKGVERMLLHIKEHLIERNTLLCPVLKCEKSFNDPKEFRVHLKAHTGHKPFKCSDCGKRFFLRENYEMHAKRHGILKNWSSMNTLTGEPAVKTKSSQKSPTSIESTIANLEASESDVDRKFRWTPHCTNQPICDRSEFLTSSSKSVPLAEENPRKSQANIKSQSTEKSQANLKNQSSLKSQEYSSNLDYRRQQELRKKLEYLKSHNYISGNDYPRVNEYIESQPKISSITTIPILGPGSPQSISSQGSASGSSVRTLTGGGPITFKAAFRASNLLAVSNTKPSVSRNREGLCHKDSNGRLQYYQLTENSRGAIQAVNAELRKYPRSGRCDVCKKFCSRLDKHMMVHLNQKPHLCPVCPQAFRQSEHLRRHIRARHEGNHRQFECPQCLKRLTRKDKLKEHMKICCRLLTSPAQSPLGESLFAMIPGSD